MTQFFEYSEPLDSGEFPAISPLTPYPTTDGMLSAIHRTIKFEKIEYSGPSLLIFGLDERTGEQVVLKVLVEETDPRYNFSTVERRQLVQSHALYLNARITPDVYLGLVSVNPFLDSFSPGRTIELGPVNDDPEPENLNKALEYGILMHRLPDDLQLKHLLMQGPQSFRPYFVKLVATRIAHMHQDMEPPDFLEDNAQNWGSREQLQKKLGDNIQFADQKLVERPAYQEIAESLKNLHYDLSQLPFFQERFELRRSGGYIKCCHGDLKTQNIWIIPDESSDNERWRDVKILDAIDFNPVYSNIDILSDFAMLVVDVEIQTDAKLADEMVKKYLALTNQENDEARFILNYYLIEKALVSATTRSVKEDLPEPDLTFLDVARRYLYKLRQYTRQFKRIEIPIY
jgi:aminoglycoside phosphotransferase family enzyme